MTSKVERLREQAEKIQTQLREAEAAEKERAAARAKARLDRVAKKSGLTKLLGVNDTISSAVLEKEFRELVERLGSGEKVPLQTPGSAIASPSSDTTRHGGIFNR